MLDLPAAVDLAEHEWTRRPIVPETQSMMVRAQFAKHDKRVLAEVQEWAAANHFSLTRAERAHPYYHTATAKPHGNSTLFGFFARQRIRYIGALLVDRYDLTMTRKPPAPDDDMTGRAESAASILEKISVHTVGGEPLSERQINRILSSIH